MKLTDLPDEIVADIFRRNTRFSEFDEVPSSQSIAVNSKKIKQELSDALEELERRPHSSRNQEL